MHFPMHSVLGKVTPIVRGRCNVCGHCRNLWVTELGGDPVECSCRGCAGRMEVVYTGPKAFLPAALDTDRCSCRPSSSSSSSVAAGGTLAALLDMGFPEAAARQAAARCGSVDEAVELLTDPSQGLGAAPSGPSSSSTVQERLEDIGECSICCEELLLATAAMRCSGEGGKKHYFHAQCLTAWVRQCQASGSPPTCPECRGPVQVRPRRLQEFLQEKGGKLDTEDREAFQTFNAGAEGAADDDGWSNLRKDLWKGAAVLAIGAGLALAIAAGVQAMNNRDKRRRDD